MLNGIKKGKAGEREAAKWLHRTFGLEFEPRRNLDQTREGGFDLKGFPPLAIEVKRQETVSKRAWWLQACASCNEQYPIPVVMYRVNRGRWHFLLSAKLIGLKGGYIELEERTFIKWVRSSILGANG